MGILYLRKVQIGTLTPSHRESTYQHQTQQDEGRNSETNSRFKPLAHGKLSEFRL